MHRERSNFGRAIGVAIETSGVPQMHVARRAGVSQTSLNRIINYARRPDPATLTALCHCWAPAENIRILIEHLRDEITRAQHASSTISIRPAESPTTEDIARMLALLDTYDPDAAKHIRRLVSAMYRLVTDGLARPHRAAESPAEYGSAAERKPEKIKSPRKTKPNE